MSAVRGRTDTESSTPRDQRHDFWGVVLEAPDGLALARFYAELLGWEWKGDRGWATVAPPEGVAYLGFQSSEEYVRPLWPAQPGAQQQMLHLDFEVDDLAAAGAHARRARSDGGRLSAQTQRFGPPGPSRAPVLPLPRRLVTRRQRRAHVAVPFAVPTP